MWARIQEMAIRRETPDELHPGDKAGDVTIRQRIPGIVGNRRYRGFAEMRPFEVRQFYDVDTSAFLRWQQQARYAHLPEHPSYVRACREWDGGVILPDPRLPTLAQSTAREPMESQTALDFAYRLAVIINTLHKHCSAHLNLCMHSVLRDPATNSPALSRFGQSLRNGWQDLWANTRRQSLDWRFAAPELIRGDTPDTAADVFAFGTLLQEITTPSPERFSLTHWLVSMPLLWKLLSSPTPDYSLPQQVRALISATREYFPHNRPCMDEVIRVLAETASEPYSIPPEIEEPPRPGPPSRRRVMLFIKPDKHAGKLFDEAVIKAPQNDDALLFVSLIPLNLAYGELEMFKARLFKTLGKGLRACRDHNILWGLRLLENVDAERAAERIVRQFSPDLVVCGRPSDKGVLRRMTQGVVRHIEKAQANLILLDSEA